MPRHLSKYFILSCWLLLLSCSIALAQEEETTLPEPGNRSFAVYAVIPTFAISAPSALNSNLLQNGYPRIPRGNFNLGLGAQHRWGRFITGVDLMVNYQAREREDENSQLVRKALTTQLYAGVYVFRKPDWLAIYPYTALSFTEAAVYLTKPTPPTPLNGLLAVPGNTVKLNHFSGGMVVGIGIDMQDSKKIVSIFQSFKVGYRFLVEAPYDWESRFTMLSNVPADRFNYWFIQFNFGGAWHWLK